MTNGGKARAMINSDKAWAMTDEKLAGLCGSPVICPVAEVQKSLSASV